MKKQNKVGKTFIAYQGDEYSSKNIEEVLNNLYPKDYYIEVEEKDDVVFASATHTSQFIKTIKNDIWMFLGLTENNRNEIVESLKKVSINPLYDGYYYLDTFYMIEGKKIFKDFNDVNFCGVFYCYGLYDKKFVAGLTNPNISYIHLYYGYTNKKKEIMFSNNKKVLSVFCDMVKEMEPNTYVENNILYDLDGKKLGELGIKKVKVKKL